VARIGTSAEHGDWLPVDHETQRHATRRLRISGPLRQPPSRRATDARLPIL